MRGLARLLLSHVQLAVGRAHVLPPQEAIHRLVFVCQGNICRSAFAEVVARELGARSISIGLSTQHGRPAHPPAVKVARDLGYDMSAHRATAIERYRPLPGDLLLAMEVRHLAHQTADPHLSNTPRLLLGRFATPERPHLHDPFGLDERYMGTCLAVIEHAVVSLVDRYSGSRICG